MVTGLLAAFIAISSDWISDIKEGHCKSGFYLNRKFCCWGNPGKYFTIYIYIYIIKNLI